MNEIKANPIQSLGYNFIDKKYLPDGKDEYHLRNIQNRNGITYRRITAHETEVLLRNNNISDNWDNVRVSDSFDPELVKNCKFFGLVRIGKLEPLFLDFHDVRLPVGLYDSVIISCDFGDNVVISNVNYLSHYIIGNNAVIVNVHELAATDHAKFGNGIIKVGEQESVRIWLEICNENAGRSVIPFIDMLPGDAYIWSRYRDDKVLMEKFKEFTQEKYDPQRGYYGKIGDRTIIKNTGIIKDVWVGSDAYIKGANKLKNLTINSNAQAMTQIGEGCELVNGIISEGCRVFYGVKAVRFILASNSQLKYGARLINSYLGNNATISCCEVLNSLIFPAHEQHHNNSFLCAALIMGQSNMAAGATIGSNHNSRSADGEIIAGRGFWPGLCVSLKHNSKFATFCLISKGDFPAELNIPFPFALVHNDVSRDKIVIMPAYWFMYNMYALSRNANKYVDRDKRKERIQHIDYDYLAPDSVNEMFSALELLEIAAAESYAAKKRSKVPKNAAKTGRGLLHSKNKLNGIPIHATNIENSQRQVEIVKAAEAYKTYRQFIIYYGAIHLLKFIRENNISDFNGLKSNLPTDISRKPFINVGGQIMPTASVKSLITDIHEGRINNWSGVHLFYMEQGEIYEEEKALHAYASLLEILDISPKKFDNKVFRSVMQQALETNKLILDGIVSSRAKDYSNPFRKMVYESIAEMEEVVGKLEENSFIRQQQKESESFQEFVKNVIAQFSK